MTGTLQRIMKQVPKPINCQKGKCRRDKKKKKSTSYLINILSWRMDGDMGFILPHETYHFSNKITPKQLAPQNYSNALTSKQA